MICIKNVMTYDDDLHGKCNNIWWWPCKCKTYGDDIENVVTYGDDLENVTTSDDDFEKITTHDDGHYGKWTCWKYCLYNTNKCILNDICVSLNVYTKCNSRIPKCIISVHLWTFIE